MRFQLFCFNMAISLFSKQSLIKTQCLEHGWDGLQSTACRSGLKVTPSSRCGRQAFKWGVKLMLEGGESSLVASYPETRMRDTATAWLTAHHWGNWITNLFFLCVWKKECSHWLCLATAGSMAVITQPTAVISVGVRLQGFSYHYFAITDLWPESFTWRLFVEE